MKQSIQWKAVRDYPRYEISNDGKVLSKIGKPKILRPGTNQFGYQYVLLTNNEGRKIKLVSRLVAEAFLPTPKEGQTDVDHISGEKLKNSVNNLRWSTRQQNIVYAIENGTKHGVKPDDLPTVFKLRQLGVTQSKIGEIFDVKQSSIQKILSGVSHRSITLLLANKYAMN